MLEKTYSLKKRLIVFLLTSSFIPVVLIGIISYISLYSLLNNNIDNGIINNLKQIKSSLDNSLGNLERSSLLLALNGRIVIDIEKYINSGDNLEKYDLKKEIQSDMAIVSTVKPNLGLIFFYFPENREILFENMSVNRDFDYTKLPKLANGIDSVYYAPHRTADYSGDNTVFSVMRKLNLIETVDVFVYMETDSSLFKNLLNAQQSNLKMSQVLLDDRGVVVYSQIEKDFPVGLVMDAGRLNDKGKTRDTRDGYFIFSQKGDLGWRVLGVISIQDYNAEIYKWGFGLILIALLSVISSVLLARSLWRMVYKPLAGLNAEISLMAQSQFSSPVRKTGIHEFDKLLGQFELMRGEIVSLIHEIKEKENKKRVAEVEKLLHQINPHFIHNTLNTIQWMARMNGQDEIDRFVALFTRVLQYNLGKEGGMVPLREEIAALDVYIELQKMRYKYQFQVGLDISEDTMDIRIPRFIVQPIVENAIYHGLRGEGGAICISARLQQDHVSITVHDNGAGMTEEETGRLLAGMAVGDNKTGLGIGLSYVKHIMYAHYGDDARLEIISRPDTGTEFTLVLPLTHESRA